MDMDQAAVFLAGSILIVLGFLVILTGIVIANNIVAKYWKSWGWKWMGGVFFPDRPPMRFMTEEEANRIAPTFAKQPGTENEIKDLDLSKNR